jgi:SAM-dependent methyltransferase
MDRKEYLDKQRRFWEITDPDELKFNRVDTLYGSDRTSERFDAEADERVGWLLHGLSLPAEPRIVEIGCGIGAVLARVARRLPGAQLWGFDISATMIAEAEKTLGGDPRVHLAVNHGDTIDAVPDRSIDLAICTGVFIHILDIGVIRSYVSEAHRVLRPGGTFKFNARLWNPSYAFGNSLGGRWARFLYRVGWRSALKPKPMRPGEVADFNGLYFTVGEIEQLVREAGLIPEQFILQTTDESPTAGHIRVTCRRPAAG